MYEPLGRDGVAKPWWRKKRVLIGVPVVVAILIVSIILIVSETKKTSSDNTPELPTLASLMSQTNLYNHLQSLQDIADANGGSRDALHGYNASVAYVIERIKSETNFTVETQNFTFFYWWEMSTPLISQVEPYSSIYVAEYDFTTLLYTGSGNAMGLLYFVGGGCQDSDYVNFQTGEIALVQRNELDDCSVLQKVTMATTMGASAILIWTDASYGLFTRGLSTTSTIPALSVSFEWGSAMFYLMSSENITINVTADTVSANVVTTNIIVDTQMGDPTQTIIVGSHLDSVPTGPGINDNGSGTSVNLELAIQLLKSNIQVKNRIKFAWWAAEEFGHLGSEAYVEYLQQTNQLDNVALNLNYDMEGSPNYITMLYNGSTADSDIRNTCEVITQTYIEYFTQSSTPFELIEFGGGSDYQSFAEVGIPVGGLSSGVYDIKTPEQKAKFGGIAYAPCDPCYHSACDTLDNVSMESVLITARSAAYVLQSLAGMDLK